MEHLVVLTGAGISAESGVKTFREAGGLWEGHDVMEVASPQGFNKNPELVLDFYNQRRRQLKTVEPNSAHIAVSALESKYKITVVTQNVDNLHERAGSKNVMHLHGELTKVRSIGNPSDIKTWEGDLNLGDTCEKGYQLRPHIVWFGEEVPMIDKAISVCESADILLIIGTSLQVYPAAGLMNFTPYTTPVYYIDPNPSIDSTSRITVIPEKATQGMVTFHNLIQ